MKPENKNELRAAVAAIVEEGRRRVGGPPSEELLLAYSRGELSEQESDRVRELLSHYPESVRLLADLAALEPEPGDPDYLSDEELEKDWQSLQEKLGRMAASAEVESEHTATPLPTRSSKLGVPLLRVFTKLRDLIFGDGGLWRLTAAMGWVVAISLLVFPPSSDLPSEPYVQPLTTVHSDETRGGEQAPPFRLTAQDNKAPILVLTLVQPIFQRYRLELHADGEPQAGPIWSQSDLSPDGDDSFPVALPRGFLRPGRYQFRLYGVDEEGERLEATYTVEW